MARIEYYEAALCLYGANQYQSDARKETSSRADYRVIYCRALEVTMNQAHASTTVRVIEFKYNWSIENFSFLSKETGVPVTSLPFTIPGTESNWCLKLYPGGMNTECKGYVSVLLKLLRAETPELMAKFRLCLEKNNNIVSDSLETGLCNFGKEEYGFLKVVKWDVLVQPENGRLLDDKLVIVSEIKLSVGVIDNSYENQVLTDRAAEKCQAQFINDIYDIYLKRQLTDVTLLVDGKQFYAHKAILAARSLIFADLFVCNPAKSEFDFDDIDSDAMEEVLRYLYSGKIIVNNYVVVTKILEVAITYQFHDYNLEKVCEARLIGEIDASNVAELLMFADYRDLYNLQQAAIKYIVGNCGEVMSTQGYKDMVDTHPELVSKLFSAVVPQNKRVP